MLLGGSPSGAELLGDQGHLLVGAAIIKVSAIPFFGDAV